MQGILPSKVNNIMLGHNNNPEETMQPLPRVISLNVGGHHFVTTLSTLTKENSMLATMFSGRHNLETDSKGRYFIDRDGTRFLYILNYLRDEMHLPPVDVALQVYKEAQFYQIQSLIDILERYSNVFALKLENAKKSKLGIELEKSQAALITRAQNKSLLSLSSTSKVSLLSQEDHKKIMECGDCVGPHAHNLVVAKPFKQGFVHHQESVDNVQRRLKSTELVICNLTNQQMKLFIDITESDLRENGYHCEFREETIRCKNIKLHYGIGKEECSFHVTENVVEFQW